MSATRRVQVIADDTLPAGMMRVFREGSEPTLMPLGPVFATMGDVTVVHMPSCLIRLIAEELGGLAERFTVQ